MSLVELLIEFGLDDDEVIKNVSGPLIREKHGRPLIGCSHSMWYYLIRQGDLQAVRVGGNTLVTAASLRDLLQRGRSTPARKLKSNIAHNFAQARQ